MMTTSKISLLEFTESNNNIELDLLKVLIDELSQNSQERQQERKRTTEIISQLRQERQTIDNTIEELRHQVQDLRQEIENEIKTFNLEPNTITPQSLTSFGIEEVCEVCKVCKVDEIDEVDEVDEIETSFAAKNSYIVQTRTGPTLQIPKIDNFGKYDLTREEGFLTFEAELVQTLGSLTEVHLRSDDGLLVIEPVDETEICLEKYCYRKYCSRFSNFRGDLPPFPVIYTRDNRGAVKWLLEMFKFKYTYLLSDKFMWPEMKRIIETTFANNVDEDMEVFIDFVTMDDPFDKEEGVTLEWNDMFLLLRSEYIRIGKGELDITMDREFVWLKRFPEFNPRNVLKVARRYTISVKKILKKGLNDWIDTAPNGVIWYYMFPKVKLMILAILNNANGTISCDPGRRNPKLCLFGKDINIELDKVLEVFFNEVKYADFYILQHRLSNWLKEEPTLINGVCSGIEWGE